MRRLPTLAGVLTLAVILAGGFGRPLLAQTESTPATAAPAAGEEAVTLQGVVRETFLNRFIMDAAGSRVLVEPIGTPRNFTVLPDETVTVTGRRHQLLMQATRITRATGEVIHESPVAPVAGPVPAPPKEQVEAPPALAAAGAPAAPRTIPGILASLGLEPLGEAVRSGHHTEVLARMKDGRSVYVSFDLAGGLWEIEDADHDKERVTQQAQLTDQALFARATAAGFSPVAVIERKRRHAVLSARNQAGEPIELHIDLAGYIYKQVWPR